MKHASILYMVCATMAAFASCSEDLDIGQRHMTPRIVLNCVASAGHPLQASVSRTALFHELEKSGKGLTGANVRLTVNGTSLPDMTAAPNNAPGIYGTNYVPKAGDHIRLDVTTPLGNVWAEDVMPRLTPIDDVKFYFTKATQNRSEETVYNITFTDNPSERNYYFVSIVPYGGGRLWLDFSKDRVFHNSRDGLNAVDEESMFETEGEGMVFSDDLINGKTYTLRIAEVGYNAHEHKRVDRLIRLYSISRDYHLYLSRIFNESEDSFNSAVVEAGLAEPSPHHININGGTGILGMMQVDRRIVNIGVEDSTEGTRGQ